MTLPSILLAGSPIRAVEEYRTIRPAMSAARRLQASGHHSRFVARNTISLPAYRPHSTAADQPSTSVVRTCRSGGRDNHKLTCLAMWGPGRDLAIFGTPGQAMNSAVISSAASRARKPVSICFNSWIFPSPRKISRSSLFAMRECTALI